MRTYLDGIIAWHRERAATDKRSSSSLVEQALAACEQAPARDFAGAICSRRDSGGVALVAEIKRHSPSKGALDLTLNAAAAAHELAAGGASCLSVLTDERHFNGSADDLREARKAVGIPVLRKDFTVCAADLADARLMGADAVLLICAVLSDAELTSYVELAGELGMAALVEVHDETEGVRAVDAGARLIGVNQRDLQTFQVDTGRAARVARSLPPEVLKVAESGITSAAQVQLLGEAGYDAVLVGETIMRAPAGPGRSAVVRSLAEMPREEREPCG